MLLNRNLPPNTVSAERLLAVVFDWAGTTVDFGSLAPVRTLQKVFSQCDIAITEEEGRRDMGIAKRDHIERILALPRVKAAWTERHGNAPADADVESLYQEFLPLQFACLPEYSAVIDGVPEVIANLRKRGLKIGSTTGYTRYMLDLLVENSAKDGYAPDCSLSPEDVGAGRPQPFMLYQAAVRLHVSPLSAVVKVGDTVADIEEGLNAGAWSVGVVRSGNMIGLSETDFKALPQQEQEQRMAAGRAALQSAGAHYVIDSLQELEAVLDDIESRLQQLTWQRPSSAPAVNA